ncbi:MAG: PorV/PorQ family protein, partial [Bacteroidota bacterium]
MRLKKIASVIFISIITVSASAQQGGESLFGILHLTPSARMNALGGHQVALSENDPSMALYNPALADSSLHKSVSLGFSPYIADINYGYGSFAYDIAGTGTFFSGIKHMGFGDMIMADENGKIQGTFGASETVIFLGYSKKLSSRLTAGLTFKPVFSTIETYNSWGISFDAG